MKPELRRRVLHLALAPVVAAGARKRGLDVQPSRQPAADGGRTPLIDLRRHPECPSASGDLAATQRLHATA